MNEEEHRKIKAQLVAEGFTFPGSTGGGSCLGNRQLPDGRIELVDSRNPGVRIVCTEDDLNRYVQAKAAQLG